MDCSNNDVDVGFLYKIRNKSKRQTIIFFKYFKLIFVSKKIDEIKLRECMVVLEKLSPEKIKRLTKKSILEKQNDIAKNCSAKQV